MPRRARHRRIRTALQSLSRPVGRSIGSIFPAAGPQGTGARRSPADGEGQADREAAGGEGTGGRTGVAEAEAAPELAEHGFRDPKSRARVGDAGRGCRVTSCLELQRWRTRDVRRAESWQTGQTRMSKPNMREKSSMLYCAQKARRDLFFILAVVALASREQHLRLNGRKRN